MIDIEVLFYEGFIDKVLVDMPAHLKSSIFTSNILIPISNGQLNLGTWQGIYLGEHRDFGGSRKIVATIIGK